MAVAARVAWQQGPERACAMVVPEKVFVSPMSAPASK